TNWQDCNCHGWVFAGGRFFIASDDVPDILKDNGYYEVAHPRAGDLALYRYGDGRVAHTGIVYSAQGGHVEVQSKWGILGGVYRHASHVHPYQSCQCAYYRTPRGGHLLHGLDAEVAERQAAGQEFVEQAAAGRSRHELP